MPGHARRFCRKLYKNDLTDRFAVLVVESEWPEEAQVQSYSPGGSDTNVEGTLAPPGEY